MKSISTTTSFAVFVIFIFTFLGCSHATFRIFEKPVVFDEVRKELSIRYLEERYGIIQNFPSIDPRMIVIHWTAIPTLESSFNAMNTSLLPGARTALSYASDLNEAVQFLHER